MSDDLVKRLRDTPNWKRDEYGDYKSARVHYDRAPFEAADRIEELEERLKAATDDAKEAEAYAEELEVKLVEAMEEVATYSNDPHLAKWARTALAELKGEK